MVTRYAYLDIIYLPCHRLLLSIAGAELALWRVCSRVRWPDPAGVPGGQRLWARHVSRGQVSDSVRHVWTRAISDRDRLVMTTLRRAAEETPEDWVPPFMSSVTYKVPQIPWYTDPHHQQSLVVVTNYYKCFFQIFYTEKINETKFGVIQIIKTL